MCLGIPGQIVAISDEAMQTGIVQVSGVKREANLSCVVPADGNLQTLVGSWALVRVGFAMSIIDEEEARRTLEILAEIGELQEELDAMQQGAQG